MRFTKDDIILLILGVFLAAAITSPILLIGDINKRKMEDINKAALLQEEQRIEKELKEKQKEKEQKEKDKLLEEIKKVNEEKEKEEQNKQEQTIPVKEPAAQVSQEVQTVSTGENFYRNKLSSREQQVYDLIYSNILSFNENYFEIPSIQVDSLLLIHKYIILDKEDLFYLDSIKYISNTSKYCTKVKLIFSMSKSTKNEKQKQIDSISNNILKNVTSLSEYEKTKYIHDYIVKNTKYVLGSANSQDITSVLLNNESVCAGYARTFQYLLRKSGIYSIYVTGNATNILASNTSTDSTSHAWNLIRLDDGKYYYVDITFDDPTYIDNEDPTFCSHEYFNITSKELLLNHKIDADLPTLPEATATKYNYYVKENLFFKDIGTSTLEKMTSIFKSGSNNKLTNYSFKFDSYATYKKAVDVLIKEDKKMGTLLRNANKNSKNKYVDTTFSYVLSKDRNIISFVLKYK